jgi:hypothetical protein
MRDEARERARSMVSQAEPSEEALEVCHEDRIGYFGKLNHQCLDWLGHFIRRDKI